MATKRPRIPRKEIELLCEYAAKWIEHAGIRLSGGYLLKPPGSEDAIRKAREFLAAKWPQAKKQKEGAETIICARCGLMYASFNVCVRDGIRLPYYCESCRQFLTKFSAEIAKKGDRPNANTD